MELQQLLKECKKGSITAQKYLYDTYALQLFLLCRRYMKNDVVAEEVMMNGFLKVFHSLPQFTYQDDVTALAWIKKIMVNECLQVLRQKNSFLLTAEDATHDVVCSHDIIAKLSADEIFKVITQLPVGYRTVFNLYVMEDMNHKEIAALLGITEGTSKSQLSKARAVLQQLIIKNNSDYAGRKAR